MQRILWMAAFVLANVLTMSGAKKTVIDRIEPTDWYVGMKNPQVQLMVYGQGIRDVAEVTTDYPGATIDSLVRLDSPNYLLVYMNLKGAQPGTMTLTFKGGKVKGQAYRIHQRRRALHAHARPFCAGTEPSCSDCRHALIR